LTRYGASPTVGEALATATGGPDAAVVLVVVPPPPPTGAGAQAPASTTVAIAHANEIPRIFRIDSPSNAVA
jgi:hypothetical protein